MTNLNVSLSAALQTELDAPGIWAYAVYFDANGSPVWTNLVVNGAVQNTGPVAISLPSTYVGGKVYFIVQSQDQSQPFNLPGPTAPLIRTQSDINWASATAYDFRYDSFEVTLQSSSTDAGNLSSVNGFGLPMEVSVPYDNGTTATAGYGISGITVADDIQNISTSAIYDYTSGPLSGDFRMALSPTESVSQPGILNPPFQPSDWTQYIQSLEGAQAQGIVLSGEFNGAPDANGTWHNGGYFAYQLSWDGTNFWLLPLASSQIKGAIQLSPTDLENSIYSTLGNANIYTNQTDLTPYLTMNTGANNQWGKVLSEFLTGFTGGFYGAAGKLPNPQYTTAIDLNHNLNWDPIFAFGQNLAVAPPAYQTSDPYSQIFYDNSNSYGSGYSDALMSQYTVGGPLISVSQPGTTTNVPNINLTIFADGETPVPPTSQGYTVPQIANYIAPEAGGYAVPDTIGAPNITLDFASSVLDNAGVVLASTDAITLSILTSDVGNTPIWNTVTLDGQSKAAGTIGLWQNWTITGSAGNYIATPTPNSEPIGSLLISGFPVATSGVGWYQIGVGAKTFNLYTTTSGGLFKDPDYTNQQGALAIDGLATITPPQPAAQTIPTFTVNFSVGDTVTYDPSLLVPNTANARVVVPDAPVAGTLSGGTFTALPGQTDAVSNTITATVSDISFAWTGENPNALVATQPASPWIEAYTNKIDAEDVALITITRSSGSPITTTGTADIDGQWQTGTVDLANGAYTVTMAAYLPADTGFANPLTSQSNALTLTVDAPCFVTGTLIRTTTGEIPVECLAVGDMVLLHRGTAQPITWIGHRNVDCTHHPKPRNVWPVRVAAHAFGYDRPYRDLWLSPDHAIYLDGSLIPVKYLINGTTVTQVPVDAVTYHHIELPDHDVVLSNGLPTESYLDTGDRMNFTNNDTAIRLHPDFSEPLRTDGTSLAWEARAGAPLVVTGEQLAAARRLLTEIAVALPARTPRPRSGRGRQAKLAG